MGSHSSNLKRFTVAIVGGGLGGLVVAIGLLRRKVPVRIYEASTSFRETGLGLTVGPAAHRALRLIDPHIRDIYDTYVTTTADSPGFEDFSEIWFEIVWASGKNTGQVLMDLKAPPMGQTTLRRADFIASLVALIPTEIAHFHKKLLYYEEKVDGVQLYFEDASSATADLVIGCDGIHSKVKESMLPNEIESTHPRYSGMYCYRAVVNMEDAVAAVGNRRARVPTWYIGTGSYVVTYPILRAKKIYCGMYKMSEFWMSNEWKRSASKQEMHRDMAHMGTHVHALLEYMADTSQWAVFDHPDISTFCNSRVTILGDAAHASTPHQGAGAGQAIEDAHVLSELLSDDSVHTTEDAIIAFQAYDAIRRPRSQMVVSSSKENALLQCLCHDDIGDDAVKLKAAWEERFRWLWEFDVQNQVNRARAMLRKNLSSN